MVKRFAKVYNKFNIDKTNKTQKYCQQYNNNNNKLYYLSLLILALLIN